MGPERGREGRLAWQSETPEGLEIYHAWIVQDLEGGRVRVLTQESQIGPVCFFRGRAREKEAIVLT